MRTTFPPVFAILFVALAGCSDGDAVDPGQGAVDTVADTDDASDGDATGEDDGHADPGGDVVDCFPNLKSCLGVTTTATCNATGDGWASVEECDEGLVCFPDSVKCKLPVCTPGKRECRALDEFRVCQDDGLGWQPTEQCPEGTYCQDGICGTCDEGATQCADDTNIQTCHPDGSWSDPAPCPDGGSCVDGTCCERTDLCTSETEYSKLCVDGEGAIVEQDDGICPLGEFCADGSCFVCEPDTKKCFDDSQFQVCDAEGRAWGAPTACPSAHVCISGECTYINCLGRVVLVVDRSGSMSGDWQEVKDAIVTMVASKKAIFGMMAFPTGGSCNVSSELDVPMFFGNDFVFDEWMSGNGPGGSTPLVAAMQQVESMADELWQGKPGTVVVLSDGEDTCFSGNEEDALSGVAQNLLSTYDVNTYVIGWAYSGSSTQLDALASNGGTDYDTFLPASSAEELTNVFEGIVSSIKLCD